MTTLEASFATRTSRSITIHSLFSTVSRTEKAKLSGSLALNQERISFVSSRCGFDWSNSHRVFHHYHRRTFMFIRKISHPARRGRHELGSSIFEDPNLGSYFHRRPGTQRRRVSGSATSALAKSIHPVSAECTFITNQTCQFRLYAIKT